MTLQRINDVGGRGEERPIRDEKRFKNKRKKKRLKTHLSDEMCRLYLAHDSSEPTINRLFWDRENGT